MFVCKNCNRQGEIEGPPYGLRIHAHRKACPSCEGKRELDAPHVKCEVCGGWGDIGPMINPRTCPGCNGVGVIFTDETSSHGNGRLCGE